VNKLFAGLGLILVLAGLAVSAVGSINFDQWETPAKVVQRESNSWTVAANFTAGENLTVNIVINLSWQIGSFEIPDPGEETPYPYGHIEVYLDVIDPYGNTTKFTYIWMRYPSRGGEYILMKANLTVDQSGSLIDPGIQATGAENPGGMVRHSGLYVANITGISAGASLHYPDDPPSVMELSRTIQVHVQPYSSALPFGVASFIGGAVVSIYGVRLEEGRTGKNRHTRRKGSS